MTEQARKNRIRPVGTDAVGREDAARAYFTTYFAIVGRIARSGELGKE